ncbi:MAG: type II secretion system protein M, partial [Betaproteobacteria bacterium]|nr:type II secretion system protein M [Betaproteobacteria bacterium]
MKIKSIDWRPYLVPLWQVRTPRERLVLGLLGALLAVMVAYALLWRPAQTHVAQLERELPELRADFARMQAMAGELMMARSRGAAAMP